MRKILLSGLVAISLFGWGGNNNGNCQGNGPQSLSFNSTAYNKHYSLTKNQVKALQYMYEEEKLARDVYITLGKKYPLRPFLNIQKSEQYHMNAIFGLLKKYNIPSNVNNQVGKFNIPELSNLYNELITKGLKSKKDALEVGVEVEKLDIKDLKERMQDATPDMKIVFSRLLNGSYHHLKAFNRFLGFYN